MPTRPVRAARYSPGVELRPLRSFVVLAEELHFGRAAARLFISQPSLSVQIKNLEKELGVELLDRSTRHVELTAAGEELQRRLERVLPMLEDALTGLSDVRDGISGRLSVGFISSAGYVLLPEAVHEFRARRPRVALRLRPLTTADQVERVLEGRLDVGIVRDPLATPDLAVQPIVRERLVVAVAADHPLAHLHEVLPEDLAGYPMIGYPHSRMPGFVDLVNAALAPARTAVRWTHTFVHQETAIGFVAAGEGASIMPENLTSQLPPTVRTLPFITPLRTEMCAITRPAEERSAAAEAFLECLADVAPTDASAEEFPR